MLIEKSDIIRHLESNSVFLELRKLSSTLGKPIYVVGGYVRDLLLWIPNDDIDIVVIGSGIMVAKAFAKQVHSKEITTYSNYGTARVKYNGSQEIEFVGARKESYYRGSRNPIVENGTLLDDLKRRDFTINAMAISLCPDDFGTIIDPLGGLEDLRQEIIRTPLDPQTTFSDDPLRMLRCVRFVAKLGFSVTDNTLDAMRNCRDRLGIISTERISTELGKILLQPYSSTAFKILNNLGILELILPELSALDNTGSPDIPKKHKNNFLHTLKVVENIGKYDKDNLWLRWAVLLHDIGKTETAQYSEDTGWTFSNHEYVGADMIKGIFQRLKLPNKASEYVEKLVKMHMRPSMIPLDEVTPSAIRRLLFDAGDDIRDLIILCRSDITTKYEEKREAAWKRLDRLEEMLRDLVNQDRIRLFQPCLDGNDIMKELGIGKGRIVGEIKAHLKNLILDGLVENEPEALRIEMRKFVQLKGYSIP